jgi:hypothetical protein
MLRGFYSKDFVLECMNYSSSCVIVIFIILLNVFFTYYYTYQLFYYSFSSNKVFSFQIIHQPGLFHTCLIITLGVLTLLFPRFLLTNIYSSVLYLPVPSSFKFFPVFLNLFTFIFLLLFLKQLSFKSKNLHSYFSTMMFLSPFIMSVMSNLYYNTVFYLVKSFELGLINYSFNSFLPNVVSSSSKWLLLLCNSSPLRTILFSLPLVFLLLSFLLSNITNYI